MSVATLEPVQARAGQLACLCETEAPLDGDVVAGEPTLTRAATGFALTVLTQALTVAVLPLAGATLAPGRFSASLPFAAMLVGAAVATLPASVLTDRFGRRSAFALGGSLGLAGACLAAWSLAAGIFAGLVLGSFWLGAAQGFGLFFRHSAAMHAADRTRAIGIVLGAGAFAALAAPALLSWAQREAGPFAPAVALAFAGVAQLAVLALAVSLRSGGLAAPAAAARPLCRTDALATGAGAAAWFGMALLMAASPVMMAMCGIGLSAASGAIALHLLSMYAPAALAGRYLRGARGEFLAVAGLVPLFGAIVAAPALVTFNGFAVALPLAGCGWSLTMLGATAALHARGAPPRWYLALNDAALFAGAIAGALAAAWLG